MSGSPSTVRNKCVRSRGVGCLAAGRSALRISSSTLGGSAAQESRNASFPEDVLSASGSAPQQREKQRQDTGVTWAIGQDLMAQWRAIPPKTKGRASTRAEPMRRRSEEKSSSGIQERS